MIEITFKPKKVSLLFLSIAVFLTLVHCIFLVSFFCIDTPDISFFIRWFDLDIENNVPSLYSSFAIFMCSFLSFIIAMHKSKRLDYEKLCWFGLGIVFLFLSFDEYFQLHENIGDIVENYINATGFLYFPWIIPYGFAVIVFILVYLKFILELPKKTATLFILTGIVYLTGAIVFDMLGGREAELYGFDSVTYSVLYTIEEFLEMISVVVLIYTFLLYIERQFGYICITLQIREINKV
ncbi:MAG: peptidase M48 Ste24p [Desulfobacteraceae bacterium]|nr:peptidase M48 Ste24p [Desulfobacteraceae bacterium]